MSKGLRVHDLCLRVGGRILLDHVSLEVNQGDFVAIVGPNGAGKSSLLQCVLGLKPFQSGAVTFDGKPVSAMSGRERAAALGWLPQRGLVREAIPVLDLVIAARFRFTETRSASIRAAIKALEHVDARPLEQRSVLTLSGGESQRVAMAVLLAQESECLLLDEPANHLDPAQQRTAYRRLAERWRNNQTIVCVTHDVNLLSALNSNPADAVRVVGIGDGKIAFENHFHDPNLATSLTKLFQIPFQAVTHQNRQHLIIAEDSQ